MKICALITIFNPNLDKLIKNINQMMIYTSKIYLLQNSPETDLEKVLNEKVSVIDNKKNIGLSAAFNIGLKIAKDEGYDFAVLFDQDSFLSESDFNILFNEYNKYSIQHKVMCIGPSLNIYGNVLTTPKWSLNSKIDSEVDSVLNIITSGMLLNINYALEIGGFNDNFPVDFCDFFFCWKSLYNGFLILKSKKAYIKHEIGNSQIKIGKSTIHFHAPYRNYFLVRDTLNICFTEKETPTRIRIRYFIFLLPRMILFLIKCDRKKDRLRMYKLGFKDFCSNKRKYGSIASELGAE